MLRDAADVVHWGDLSSAFFAPFHLFPPYVNARAAPAIIAAYVFQSHFAVSLREWSSTPYEIDRETGRVCIPSRYWVAYEESGGGIAQERERARQKEGIIVQTGRQNISVTWLNW